MLDVVDHFHIGDIRLFFSTALDVIKKYGKNYEYVEATDRLFWIEYGSIGLSFLCGDYLYNESISLHEYYVIEIEVYRPSKLTTNKGINLYSSSLLDVINAYGHPINGYSHRSGDEKVTQNYLGLRFVFKRKYINKRWKYDESLDELVEMIIVASDENTNMHMESFYNNTRIDRWLKFCTYMRRSEWGLLADGSLTFPRMHIFQYVMEGDFEAYKKSGIPGFWHERSRIFYTDTSNYDCWDDAPLFGYKSLFLSHFPENMEFQDLVIEPVYSSEKSINFLLKNFMNFEKERLNAVKQRIAAKNIDELID